MQQYFYENDLFYFPEFDMAQTQINYFAGYSSSILEGHLWHSLPPLLNERFLHV